MFFWRKKRRPARGTKPTRILVRQVALGIGSIALVVALGTGIWYGTRIDALTIDAVTVSGGETIPHEVIRTSVESQLAGSYFALVPHRFAWTYPEAVIESSIREQKRVKDVTVKRKDTELAISFTEYEPAGLWCDAAGMECLFLDADGYAFGEAPALTGGSFLRFVDPVRAPEEGAYAYDAETGARFHSFIDAVNEQYGFVVTSVVRTAPKEVMYVLGGGGELKVSLDVSLEQTLSNLATILESAEFAHLTNGDFAYIDLRYGNRVFVNEEGDVPVPEDEEVAVEETETAASEDAAENLTDQ